MTEVPQLRQNYVASSRRKDHRTKTEIEPRLARSFAAECDKHRVVERVRLARRRFARSFARRRGSDWNEQSRASQAPHPPRAFPSRKYPGDLPRKKDRWKRMNHKNYTRVPWRAIQRHTASMFLSPVSFALRTLPLR